MTSPARAPDGLYEVVGRSSRFVKLYGLRIDLQRVEAALRAADVEAICTDGDGLLLVAAAARPDGTDVAQVAADCSGLPRAAIRVVDVDEVPRLPSGKPDHPRLRALAADRAAPETEELDLRGLFADVLQIDAAAIDPGQSFVDLGGNLIGRALEQQGVDECLGQVAPELALGDVELLGEEAGRAACGAAALEPARGGHVVALLRPGERQPVAAHEERALGVSERPLVRPVPVGVAVLRELAVDREERRDRPRVLVPARRRECAGKQQRGIHSRVVRRALPAARRMQPTRRRCPRRCGRRARANRRPARGRGRARSELSGPRRRSGGCASTSAGSSSQIPASGSRQRSATVAAAISPARHASASRWSWRAAAAKSSRASPNASSWN